MTRHGATAPGALPGGVELHDVATFADARGVVAEVFRSSASGLAPAQWNVFASNARTLRGMHVHPRHTDWVCAVSGEVLIGLVDLRGGLDSTTRSFVTLTAAPMQMMVIPAGVLHGLYHPVPSVVLIGLSHPYDPDDDIALRFDDPQLGLDWPDADPVLSERDSSAPPGAQMLDVLAARGLTLPGPGD